MRIVPWIAGALLTMSCSSLLAMDPAVVPPEIGSIHFLVTLNGKMTPVMHAAVNVYFLNFDVKRKVRISVTADRDDFWMKGVEVQPWRLGIRPERVGRTISFELDRPAKISISRPGDFLGDAEMLYLFGNAPEKHAPRGPEPGLRYYGPGTHRENIDAATGDTIYLAPGAVVFGSLNIWNVDRVKVFGRGVIVYDGPQNPADDDGWMQKKNWHCIGMNQAHDISIEGITCVVRSRTWQIQMKDSRRVRFENIKVIGANSGNANADGMDWLGGGDTLVKDSFFRAADDIFAMQGSWEGYGPTAFAVDGNPVTNVTVEDSVLSTSISNVVRAGWPEKNFEGGQFTLRNSDVLHMGMGGCGIPFALLEIWADPNGRGKSAGFRLEDVRLEDWYSLVQLMEPVKGVSDVQLLDVVGLELPSMVSSKLKGSIQSVSFDAVNLAGRTASKAADIPVDVQDGADQPTFLPGGLTVSIRHPDGLVRPGQKVAFEAELPSGVDPGSIRYEWSFGDGKHSTRRKVKHSFPDTAGTLFDGSGRFRVLLHVIDASARNSWSYAPVMVTDRLEPALPGDTDGAAAEPGVSYRYFEMNRPELSAIEGPAVETSRGISPVFDVAPLRKRPEMYGAAFDGYVEAPADGGYNFTLLSNDAGRLAVDGRLLGETPKPIAQVCGSKGNAVRPVTGSVALAKGRHRISVIETHTSGDEGFRMLWRGPGFPLREIPASVLSHGAVQSRSQDQQGQHLP